MTKTGPVRRQLYLENLVLKLPVTFLPAFLSPYLTELCLLELFLVTRVASHAQKAFLAEGRTLALEEFKYALESWRHIPAIARFP
jgi:hypothetical protein